MGQQEIVDFLRENTNRWYIARDISKALDVPYGCVINNLKRLRKSNVVKFKKEILEFRSRGSNNGKRMLFMYKYA